MTRPLAVGVKIGTGEADGKGTAGQRCSISSRRLRISAFAAVAVGVLLWGATCAPMCGLRMSPGPRRRGNPVRFAWASRRFRMTSRLEAVEETRRFVRDNADLIAHHIEGVPWAEALRDAPFPKEVLSDHESKRSMKPPGAKVYLAVSPGRGDLKQPDEGATPLPPELKGKSYDDPLVQRAFLTYCRRCIEFFKPDYLAIGIETNEIFNAGADKWRAYVELHQYVYRELKKEHPDLPIFASFTLHNMLKDRGPMLGAWKELMPYNDLVAVSYYPFLAGEPVEKAFAWLTEKFDRFEKPYAMVETNDAGDRLVFPQSKNVIDGTPGEAGGLRADAAGAGRAASLRVRRAVHPSRLRCPVGQDQGDRAGAVHGLAGLRACR